MPIFKRKIKGDVFIAVAAFIVSACALAVSFYEVRIMREQQKSAVWPYIQIGEQYDEEGFSLEATNKGVGPAKIISLKAWVDKKPINELSEALDSILGKGHGIGWANTSIHNVNENVLESGYKESMVRFAWNEASRKLQKRLGRIKLEMIYQSIYDDCWVVTFDNNPEPCDCPEERIESEQFSF